MAKTTMAKTTTAVANRGGKGRIPAPMSSILWRNLSYIRNAIERDDLGRALLPAGRKPDGALRQSLSHRVALLSDQLDKRSLRQLAVIITELMDKWPQRTGESEARQTTTAFVQALQDLPPWCVAEAAERFGRGLVAGHNIAWPPSAPQVHAEARKIVQPWRDERAAILEVLQARIADTPPPPEERARVIAGLGKLRRDVAASAAAAAAEDRQRADRPDVFAKYRRRRSPEAAGQS